MHISRKGAKTQRQKERGRDPELTSRLFCLCGFLFASLRLCGNFLTEEGDDVLHELMHGGEHLRATLDGHANQNHDSQHQPRN